MLQAEESVGRMQTKEGQGISKNWNRFITATPERNSEKQNSTQKEGLGRPVCPKG